MEKYAYFMLLVLIVTSCAKTIHHPSLEGENNIYKVKQIEATVAGNSGFRLNSITINGQYGYLKNLAGGLNIIASSGYQSLSAQTSFYLDNYLSITKDSFNSDKLSGSKFDLTFGAGLTNSNFSIDNFNTNIDIISTNQRAFSMLTYHNYGKFINYHFGLKYSITNFGKLNLSGKDIVRYSDEIAQLEEDNSINTLDYVLKLNMFNRKKNLFIGLSGTLHNSHSVTRSFFFMSSLVFFGGYTLSF